MNIFEFNQQLRQYRESKHSVADEDRLRKTVESAPHKIDLTITASDRDGNYSARYEKTHKGWFVKDHWFHQENSLIPDKMVAHDLTWLLRLPNVKTIVTRP